MLVTTKEDEMLPCSQETSGHCPTDTGPHRTTPAYVTYQIETGIICINSAAVPTCEWLLKYHQRPYVATGALGSSRWTEQQPGFLICGRGRGSRPHSFPTLHEKGAFNSRRQKRPSSGPLLATFRKPELFLQTSHWKMDSSSCQCRTCLAATPTHTYGRGAALHELPHWPADAS